MCEKKIVLENTHTIFNISETKNKCIPGNRACSSNVTFIFQLSQSTIGYQKLSHMTCRMTVFEKMYPFSHTKSNWPF